MIELTRPELVIGIVVLLWLGCTAGILAFSLNAIGRSGGCNEDCSQGRRCTCMDLDLRAPRKARSALQETLTVKDS